MSTPYDEMSRIVMSEFEKCGWWVDKFLRKQGDGFKRNAWQKCLAGQDAELPVVEYKGPSGNRWVNYLYTTVADHRGVVFGYDSICYWECYGSFGAFIPYKLKGDWCLLVTTSHFWQRVCDRTDYQMQGVHTAEKFFNEHRACNAVILPPDEGDTRRRVAIHYNGGTAYGYEVSQEHHVFEIRTFIDEKSMAGKRLRERKEGTADLLSEETQQAFDDLNSYSRIHPDADRHSLVDCLDSDRRMLVDEHVRIEGQKEMERQLAELRQAMDEEQAIAAYVKNNPVTYYINRHGEHVSSSDPKMCELHVRMRQSECERLSKQDWPEIVKAFSKRVGANMSKDWRKILRPIFLHGYLLGWVTVANWTVSELPEQGEEIQAYKHRGFLEFTASVEDWIKANEFSDLERELVLRFAAYGFDRGVAKAASTVCKVLPMQCAPEETADEYMERHGGFGGKS